MSAEPAALPFDIVGIAGLVARKPDDRAAEGFVGLPFHEAQKLAREWGWEFRDLTDPNAPVFDDRRHDRINVWLARDQSVLRAEIY
jgi:hypothetical protein